MAAACPVIIRVSAGSLFHKNGCRTKLFYQFIPLFRQSFSGNC
jgi:hypothetical protein